MSLRLGIPCCLMLLAACSPKHDATGPGTNPKAVDVFTVGDNFSPAFLQIFIGDAVRFNFSGGSDGMGHDVIFDAAATGRPADIPAQKAGTASRTFNARGSFRYDCRVHPGMTGQIVVE